MIDWWGVFSNAIWISGAALALAALSYASWEASVQHQRLRQALGRSSIQAALNMLALCSAWAWPPPVAARSKL